MSRIVYVNGEYLPIEKASIPVMDRGFIFGDGIYDVAAVLNGRLVENEPHIARLFRSLGEIKIPAPFTLEEVTKVEKELIRQNNLENGLVYIQVTRGTAERDFGFAADLKPNVVMFTQSKNILANKGKGVTAVTVPDIRWARRDIKSTSLLAQVLAKNEARERGAFEAIMHENGEVTEGSSSNVFIIKNGELITRALSNSILHGITRKAVLQLAEQNNIKLVERTFTVDELYAADECFLTSATNFVIGVVEIDGKKIGNGTAGELTAKLFDLYVAAIDT
jgi:D-alanine transaminase